MNQLSHLGGITLGGKCLVPQVWDTRLLKYVRHYLSSFHAFAHDALPRFVFFLGGFGCNTSPFFKFNLYLSDSGLPECDGWKIYVYQYLSLKSRGSMNNFIPHYQTPPYIGIPVIYDFIPQHPPWWKGFFP
jgi:hypothetical protein